MSNNPKGNKKRTKTVEIVPIEISKIEVSDSNVRSKQGAEQDIEELAASIKAVGLIHPIEVMKKPGKDEYELSVGQRRLLAHQRLKRKYIDAVIIDKLGEKDILIRSLVENVHRTELNHADAAAATTNLYKRFGRDIGKVRKATGLSSRRVNQYIRIEEIASDKMKRLLREKRVGPYDVQRSIMATQGNLRKAEELLGIMAEYKLDRHQKARLVEYGESNPKWPADKIGQEARKPRVEQSVIVPLVGRLRNGLQKAVDELKKKPDEITMQALEHWLERNGYL